MFVTDRQVSPFQNHSQSRPSTKTFHARPLKALLLAPALLMSRVAAGSGSSASSLRGALELPVDLAKVEQGRQLQDNPTGKLECPCIPLSQTQLEGSSLYDKEQDCFYLQQPKGTYCYPLNYGLEGCQAYGKFTVNQ